MDIDQQTLLELLMNDDDRAYQHLYRNYFPALKSFATYYVADDEVAVDLIQDVFIGLLGNKKPFANLNDVKFYLYGALKNRCISHIRKQKVRDRYVSEIQSEALEDDILFFDRVLEEDVYAQLMAAICQLPPQCSKVMRLTIEGYKASEIASQLNISVETVKDHKQSGKKKLFLLLKDISLQTIVLYLFV